MIDPAPVNASPAPVDPRGMERNRTARLALALGILALAVCWFPLLGLFAGAAAIDYGRDGRTSVQLGRADNDGTARAAVVCGMTAVTISALVAVLANVLSLRAAHLNLLAAAGATVAVIVAARLLRSRD